MHDSVRGTSSILYSDLSNAADVGSNFQSFDTNGFTVGGSNYYNGLNDGMVAWCWKAGGAAVLNEEGSVDSQVSANQDAGFSIVDCTVTSNLSTAGHGLSIKPELVIIKPKNTTSNWNVYHKDLGADQYLQLNNTNAAGNISGIWDLIDDTVIGGFYGTWNFISYCFHSVDGYQKVGSYSGSASTVTVDLGFTPRFVMIKRTNNVNDWIMFDTVRSGGSDMDDYLIPNSSSAEYSNSTIEIQAISNGFTAASGLWTGLNVSRGEYIYLAIAEWNN